MSRLLTTAAQTSRGVFASARWLLEAPIANARIAYLAADKEAARHIIEGQFARFLKTCRVTVGVDGILPPAGVGCVICNNEPSFIDVAAFCLAMWPYVDQASGTDLYGYFPFGRASTAKSGISLISRGNRQATDRLLADMVARVRAGQRVSWGGEGRIHGQDGVGRFKQGASLIAIRAQAPVVPVTFYGGHQVMPFRKLRARPGHVQIRFGAPIETTGLDDSDARGLADRLQAISAATYATLKAEMAGRADERAASQLDAARL